MLGSTKLISHQKPKSPIAEAYKTLRTNIQFSFPAGNLKVLLVTSSGPAEGKSTTCANLAITMAESGMKVLLLDSDLRKPAQHRTFGIPNNKGLTNALVENADYKELIQNPGIKGLDILTSGPKPPNPSELLGSEKMKAFLEKLKADYDLIILDTPPVLPVTDAAVLSSLADGVVLVAAHGQATYDALYQAKASLEKVNAKILGVLLNRVPVSSHGGYYYYYYYDDQGEKHKSRRRPKIRPAVRDEDD